MRIAIKTSILGRLFPRPITKQELEESINANSRFIVGRVGISSFLLQKQRHITEKEINKKRSLVLPSKQENNSE